MPKLVEVTDVFGPFELYPVEGVQLFGSRIGALGLSRALNSLNKERS